MHRLPRGMAPDMISGNRLSSLHRFGLSGSEVYLRGLSTHLHSSFWEGSAHAWGQRFESRHAQLRQP